MGYEASTLIVQMGWTIANKLTIEPIKKLIHAYLMSTKAELEAAFIAADPPLHFLSKI
ncbi:hypothetical protein [Neochlamydia sp. AcF95]|uniref:hypothetical protein n=1 Tax=Neochlamydia sp. AcF95 TaxID=2795734 RepID=UPI001BC9B3F2|nr:hypothetical protein [Neochlamydia sp. AcF95]